MSDTYNITIGEVITSAGYANEAKAAAEESKSARDAAVVAKSAAETANTSAQSAKTSAESAATTATTKAGEASTAKDLSIAAKDIAVSAKNDAITAKDMSISAKDTAVSSASVAISSASTADTKASAATTAANNAIAAKDIAVSSSTSAQTANGYAQTAKADSLIAQSAAEAAKDIAVTKASEANTSKLYASNSAANALTSENNAKTSETASKTSETNAKTSETNALSYKTSAEFANTNAQSAKTTAQNSQTSAATSAANALTSENKAKTSETNAGNSAISAQAAATSFPTLYPVNSYKSRVEADSGSVQNYTMLKWLNDQLQKQINDAALFWDGVGGIKSRVNGNNSFAAKIYSFPGATNDASQGTTENQPYVTGLIAPNELSKIKNLKDNVSIPHASIALNSTTGFTITTVLKPNFQTVGIYTSGRYLSGLELYYTNSGNINLYNSTTGTLSFTPANKFDCKSKIVTIQANAAGIWLWVDGVRYTSISGTYVPFSTTVTALLANSSEDTFSGEISAHAIWNNRELSAAEIMIQHAALRQLHPEIEGITIGNQFWASSNFEGVKDAAGNAISEVKNISNSTVTIPNSTLEGTYSSGVAPNWTSPRGNPSENNTTPYAGLSSQNITNPAGSLTGVVTLSTAVTIIVGKLYKLSFSAKVIAGNGGKCLETFIGQFTPIIISGGTWTDYKTYFKATNSVFAIGFYTDVNAVSGIHGICFDNVNLELVGWVDAQIAYNTIYAQTSGSVAVRDYAATKAAAMWCYPNADVDLSAIHGKLYNSWAIKLLKLNPPKGWRVASEADWNQLITYCGGSTTAGMQLKAGYGNLNNAYSSNSAGLSVLDSGSREENGTFNTGVAYLATGDNSRVWFDAAGLTSLIATYSTEPMRGYPIRLMRNEPIGNPERMETTGLFTTDITSTAKQLPIPFGYVPFALRITSEQNLTNVEVKLYDTVGNAIATLITAKTVAAGTTQLFRIAVDHVAILQDATLRMTASGNSGSTFGIELQAILFKSTIN